MGLGVGLEVGVGVGVGSGVEGAPVAAHGHGSDSRARPSLSPSRRSGSPGWATRLVLRSGLRREVRAVHVDAVGGRAVGASATSMLKAQTIASNRRMCVFESVRASADNPPRGLRRYPDAARPWTDVVRVTSPYPDADRAIRPNQPDSVDAVAVRVCEDG